MNKLLKLHEKDIKTKRDVKRMNSRESSFRCEQRLKGETIFKLTFRLSNSQRGTN